MTTPVVQYSTTLTADVRDHQSVDLAWTQPVGSTWSTLRLVRNVWGYPSLSDDGTILVESTTPPLTYHDAGLTAGRQYYYSLFVLSTSDGLWHQVANVDAFVPRDFKSSERFYGLVPEVYRNQEESLGFDSQGRTPLQAYLELFGLQYDILRTQHETLFKLHDPDYVPYQFLQVFSQMMGVTYESELGPEVTRGRIRNAAQSFMLKGTVDGIAALIKGATGWDVGFGADGDTIASGDFVYGQEVGPNLMRSLDNSSFENSIGFWVADNAQTTVDHYVVGAGNTPAVTTPTVALQTVTNTGVLRLTNNTAGAATLLAVSSKNPNIVAAMEEMTPLSAYPLPADLPPAQGLAPSTTTWPGLGTYPGYLSGVDVQDWTVSGYFEAVSAARTVSMYIEWYDIYDNLICTVDPTMQTFASYQIRTVSYQSGASMTSTDESRAWNFLGGGTWQYFGNGWFWDIDRTVGAMHVAYVNTGNSDLNVAVTFAHPDSTDVYKQGLALRITDINNFIRVNRTQIIRRQAGVDTVIATHSSPFADFDRMEVDMVGDTYTVYKNGQQVSTVTDAFNDTATAHGVFGLQTAAGGPLIR